MALSINDQDQVVGNSNFDPEDPDFFHAFLWSPEEGMLDLSGPGVLDSVAHDVNNSGTIVGKHEISVACMWGEDREMRRLETPKGCTSSAEAINNLDVIVGYYRLPDETLLASFWK